jgi:glycosyltransferase involved in cell wall biosynthesis
VTREARYSSVFCLFIWPRHPGHSGGEIRDFHLLRQLLTQSDVEAFTLHHALSQEQEDPLVGRLKALHTPETIRAQRPEIVDGRAFRPTLRYRVIRWMRRKQLPVLGPPYHLDIQPHTVNARGFMAKPLRSALEQAPPDFVFVSPQLNPIALHLPRRDPRTRFIMASYDVEAVRLQRLAGASRGLARLAQRLEARRALRFERDNLARYDGIIAVSELDKEHFIRMYSYPAERILVLENGVDPRYFAFEERRRGGPPDVLYVGSLAYWPNEQAAWRLIRGIMPLVRRSHPDACLTIVGQQPHPELAAQSDGRSTVVAGRVADVRPYLAAASVGCVPLRAGSGTKYKVLEALSAGLPLVCSPVALEGLDLTPGEHLLAGESDEEIAAALARLLDDRTLASALARRGRARVEERYAWEVNLPRLDGWLARLAALPPRDAAR